MRGVPHGGRVFGAALIAVGLLALYARTGLPLGTLREPGAGFFPVIVAVALILFAALALISRNSEAGRRRAEPRGIARLWILTVLIAAYASLLAPVGFVLCTVVLLLVTLRGLGMVGWLPAVLWAAGGSAGCYFLFTRLGMPLPGGLLAF